MRDQPKIERNNAIVERHRSGEKLKDIAKSLGLSPARVGQIVLREKRLDIARREAEGTNVLREKAARAVYPLFDKGSLYGRSVALEEADRAIAAVLDHLATPTPAMLSAGVRSSSKTLRDLSMSAAAELWSAMIEVAREEAGLNRGGQSSTSCP